MEESGSSNNNKNNNKSPLHIELVLDPSAIITQARRDLTSIVVSKKKQSRSQSLSPSSILTKIHAGYFRISLSLCSQALLWKTLGEPTSHPNALQLLLHMIPTAVTIFLWSFVLLTLLLLSLLYLLRCFFYFKMVKAEFLHHVGINYFFAPWISWLLLLQSAPFVAPRTIYYLILWWVFVLPVIVLDLKIYGQWFTKGKRFLSGVANPTSLLSVMGNLAGAQAAAEMGWRESAVCMFSLGMAHYLVLFVTLYQRLSGTDRLPTMLRPVFFLFFAAPSMASLAWDSISGNFDISSKMLFFLSLFLFTSLVSRPTLFKKAMKRFNVAWWAYSFPVTMLALAAAEYAQEVNGCIARGLTYVLSGLSVLVSLALIISTALNTSMLLPDSDPILNLPTYR
ncbi:S-type anion channel SLAH4-like [Telopea speciosissima]|uniref:S-type anion channel SLAH4-like n=1 Tax=Telopea speciosissima TaxID=54955 RepID=UPI001CC3FFF1|nr:S-type anion channel SLAH4-like [Telopea speciosissima]